MKKLLTIGLALLSLLMFSGCNEAQHKDASRIPQIMMIRIHNNWAEGQQQSVTVIDRGGNLRSQSCYKNGYGDPPDEWVYLSKDGWYEKLLEIYENGEPGIKLSENEAKHIRQNVRNFAAWSGLPVKEYADHTYDYGAKALYGVYLDENGMPCLARLACVGDAMECADSAEARRFVNETGLLKMRTFD